MYTPHLHLKIKETKMLIPSLFSPVQEDKEDSSTFDTGVDVEDTEMRYREDTEDTSDTETDTAEDTSDTEDTEDPLTGTYRHKVWRKSCIRRQKESR